MSRALGVDQSDTSPSGREGPGGEEVESGGALCLSNRLFKCSGEGVLEDASQVCGEFPVDLQVGLTVKVTDRLTGVSRIHPFITVKNEGVSEAAEKVECTLELFEKGSRLETISETAVFAIEPGEQVTLGGQFSKEPADPKIQGRTTYECTTTNEPVLAAVGQ